MGNLEKAGVLVVVALLAVILVVAFLNFPEQSGKTPPVLNAGAGQLASVADLRGGKARTEPEPANVLPDPIPVGARERKDTATGEEWKILPEPKNEPAPEERPEPKADPKPDPAPRTTDDARPPETSPAKVPVAGGYPKTVKVRPGDNLWAIAVREYGPKIGPRMLGMIADANPKVRPEAVREGQEISLPAPPADLSEAKKAEPEKTTEKSTKKPPAKPEAPAQKRKLPFIPN